MSAQLESGGRSLYLFGGGAAASWVLQGFRREGLEVSGFLDDSAAEIGAVGGVRVLHPDTELLDARARQEAVVVLAVMNPAFDEARVKNRLTGSGWGEVLTLGEFGRRLIDETAINCGMLDARDYAGREPELRRVRALLSDQHSMRVFDSFVSFVLEMNDTEFPPITPEPYFPSDLPRWPQPLRMIDLGAFDGDTLESALRSGYALEASIAFEPDPDNYAILAETASRLPGAIALPLGVSDVTGQLRFASQGDAGSYVSDDGDTSIQVVRLDDAIPHFGPNLIKFDIEGSEEAALRGAAGILAADRPCLAVSIYHLTTDLWRIPLFIDSLYGPGTDYYLRRHSRTVADTVLYVFPGR